MEQPVKRGELLRVNIEVAISERNQRRQIYLWRWTPLHQTDLDRLRKLPEPLLIHIATTGDGERVHGSVTIPITARGTRHLLPLSRWRRDHLDRQTHIPNLLTQERRD
jgi:hypothetical protein